MLPPSAQFTVDSFPLDFFTCLWFFVDKHIFLNYPWLLRVLQLIMLLKLLYNKNICINKRKCILWNSAKRLKVNDFYQTLLTFVEFYLLLLICIEYTDFSILLLTFVLSKDELFLSPSFELIWLFYAINYHEKLSIIVWKQP